MSVRRGGARDYYEGLTEPERIREVYGSPRNLDAKWEVMRRYGISRRRFEEWVLENLELQGHEQVLDVGCGNGRFVLPVARSGVSVVGCDIAPGVMADLRRTVDDERLPVVLLVADAQDLPFLYESFDVVMANHMLYHVAEIDRAVREAARVLRPEGCFLATTNGRQGMKEFHDLHVATMSELGIPYVAHDGSSFDLENGAEYLEPVFGEVELHRFDDGFLAPDPEPLVMYYTATQLYQGPFGDEALDRERRDAIEPTYRRLAAEAIARRREPLVVSRPMGVFVCSSARDYGGS